MSVTVVTGFSPRGLEQYGFRFIKGFCENWPREVRLVMYLEEPIYDVRLSPIDKFIGGERRSVEMRLLSEAYGCAEFIDRHENSPAANGCDVQPEWKQKEREEGYCYRFDAVKFCRMAMFTAAAAHQLDPLGNDILVWLDGDVMTRRQIPSNFVEDLIRGANVAYLGRDPKHPDTAFVAFQRRGLSAASMWGQVYNTDEVFNWPETHSAFVFRKVVEDMRKRGELQTLNLTPGGRGHVWFQSPLATYMDHLKGQKRKRRGKSKEWK